MLIIGVLFGFAYFYISNGINVLASSLDTNKTKAERRGAFTKADQARATIQSIPVSATNTQRLTTYHRLAEARHLLTPGTYPPETVHAFIAELGRADTKEAGGGDQEWDAQGKDLCVTVQILVDYASSLNSEHDFEEKRSAFAAACKIAAAMSAEYSFASFLNRADASARIANALAEFRRSDVSAEKKATLLATCRQPMLTSYHFEIVLNKEQFRIFEAYQMATGKLRVDASTVNYRKPEPLPAWKSALHNLPNVEKALESRTYEVFTTGQDAIAASNAKNDPTHAILVVDDAWSRCLRNAETNPRNTDLIRMFAPDLVNRKKAAAFTQFTNLAQYLFFREEY